MKKRSIGILTVSALACMFWVLAGPEAAPPDWQPAPDQKPQQPILQRVLLRRLLCPSSAAVDDGWANFLSVLVEEDRARTPAELARGVPAQTGQRALLRVRVAEQERKLAEELAGASLWGEAAFHYGNLLRAGGLADRAELERQWAACQAQLPQAHLLQTSQIPREASFEDVSLPGETTRFALRAQLGREDIWLYLDLARAGVTAAAGPWYLAAERAWQAGELAEAQRCLEQLQALVVPGSAAAADLAAKQAELSLARGDPEAGELLDRALRAFSSLGLALGCRPLAASVDRAVSGERGARSAGGSVPLRKFEPLAEAGWQTLQPGPLRFLEAVQHRRAALLEAALPWAWQHSAEHPGLLQRLSDGLILCQRYEQAAEQLERLPAMSADTAFKALACRIAVLLSTAPRAEGWDTCQALLAAFDRQHPDSFGAERQLLRARCLQFYGRAAEARALFAGLAARPDFDYAADAALAVALLERQSLGVHVPELQTADGQLPIELSLRNVASLQVEIIPISLDPAAISAASPDQDLLEVVQSMGAVGHGDPVRVALDCGPAALAQTRRLRRQLRLPAPGVYLLVLRSQELSCKVAAIYDDSQARLVRMPRSSLLLLRDGRGQPLAGVRVHAGETLLGVSDSSGMLVYASEDLRADPGGTQAATPELLCVGRNRLFRLRPASDPLPWTLAARERPGPLLYLYTDRSLYLPGDVVQFCGILRQESQQLRRRPAARFDVLAGEQVRVEISDAGATLFARDYLSDAQGCFAGSYTIPASAARKEYRLQVRFRGQTQGAPFEVRDFERPDHAITLTAQAGGFELFAGTSWGSAVAGAVLRCLAGAEEREIALDEQGRAFVPAEDGQLLAFELRSGDQLLAYKQQAFQAAPSLPAAQAPVEERPKPEAAPPVRVADPVSPAEPVEDDAPPLFELVVEKLVHGAGDSIDLLLVCRGGGTMWTAVVALGDDRAFDAAWLGTRAESLHVRLPVSPAYDPVAWASVRFTCADSSALLQRRLPIRAALLDVTIDSPVRARPGESVWVSLQTRDSAGRPVPARLSLAAVDEAVFALVEDRTPDMYSFFYRERPQDCAIGTPEQRGWGACEAVAASALDCAGWQPVNVATTWLAGYGVGGGGAGAYGDRYGHGSLYAFGGSEGTESAGDAALDWAVRHQSADGRWDSDGFADHCQDGPCGGPGAADQDVLVSALTLLDFLGQGHTSRFGSHKRTIRRAQGFLMSLMADDGALGRDSGRLWLLGHAVATLALCEAYLLSDDFRLEPVVRRLLDFLLAARSEDSGWGFEPRDGRPNALVSGWAALALRGARLAGFEVPAEAWQGTLAFFSSATDPRGWTWFEQPGQADPVLGDDSQGNLPEWTAFALMARLAAGEDPHSPQVRRGVEMLLLALPGQSPEVNVQYWYAAQWAMFQIGGRPWQRWSEALQDTLLDSQRLSEGCDDGSWDATGRWGPLLGRAGSTALASLSLNIYYHYARLRADGLLEDPAEVRLHFPETAYWNPALHSGADGRVQAGIQLPDSITRLRLTSRAVTAQTLVGEGVHWLEVGKEFFVKLKTPAFFYREDRAHVFADVYNESGAPLTAELWLTGDGFELLSDARRSIEVPADGLPRRVAWQVQIGQAQRVRFFVQAAAADWSDALQLDRPVRLLGKPRSWVREQPVEAGSELQIALPAEMDRASARLEVRLSPVETPIYQLLETLRFLVDFPHGCVEQTMSRFLPAVVVADALRSLEIPVSSFLENFAEVTDAGVQRLLDFQNSDGGWGWFNDDGSYPFMSAYVVFGLHRAQRAGIPVPERALQSGVAFLQKILAQQGDPDLQACLHFALAMADAEDLPGLQALADDAGLSSYARALLALALARSGASAEASAQLEALDRMRLQSGDLAHFETPEWYFRWEDVSIECTAYALLAYVEIDPQHPAIEPLSRWLLAQRRGQKWRTTKDSAAAIYALIAVATRAGGDLAAVAAATRRSESATGARPRLERRFSASLNGGAGQPLVLDFGNPGASRFDCVFAAASLADTNRLRFDGDFSDGCPRLQAQTILRAIEPFSTLAAFEQGLRVTRSWSADPETWREGQEVGLTVEVSSAQDVDFVLVEAPIPAGGQVLAASASGDFSAFEARFDRGLFYLTALPAGSHSLRFRFRCEFPGSYTIPPARAELMYNLDIQGATASSRCRIGKP